MLSKSVFAALLATAWLNLKDRSRLQATVSIVHAKLRHVAHNRQQFTMNESGN
jgi:hypothetical protein